MTPSAKIIHATTVSVAKKGVLIIGPSGSGKSSLALQLLALGARLVADDRTSVSLEGGRVIADVPENIAGLIEARGVGLINVPPAGPTDIRLVIDMGQIESDRLPATKHHDVLGIELPCLHKVDTPHFAHAILLYMYGNSSKVP
ncbi:serine kinase [Sulfitobacter sp. TSTF-M16]|uniref:Serine kinase n=1 Tax=Sulfitobacter aestuariivivens TaxID=2766981 RepID=A0A927DAZ6_9RHOB|nr:serine kinase [Sulfitobacter aestuariivivens]